MVHTVSKHGYSVENTELTPERRKQIESDCTITPVQLSPLAYQKPKPIITYMVGKTKMYLPRHYGIQKFGAPDVNELTLGSPIKAEFKGSLRDYQVEVSKLTLDHLRKNWQGHLTLRCGFGKTCIALWIIGQLKRKTLIVVHKEFLMHQWRERIQEFLPGCTVGIIQQSVCESGSDIVIGMLHTLCKKRKELAEVFDLFGLTVFDEMHHLGAKTFSQVLKSCYSHYILGLSATPDRKDGCSEVFMQYLGNAIFECRAHDQKPSVKVYHLDDLAEVEEVYLWNSGKLNFAKMINLQTECRIRNERIAGFVRDLYKEGRRILVLSSRREHLSILGTLLAPEEPGYYLGGMKQAALDLSSQKRIILGTFQMAKEGLDIPSLDTLVLASSETDIEQAVGRILRGKSGMAPLVVDFHDHWSFMDSQGFKRLAWYKKSGFKCTGYYLQKGKWVKTPTKETKKVEGKKEYTLDAFLVDY